MMDKHLPTAKGKKKKERKAKNIYLQSIKINQSLTSSLLPALSF